MQRSADSRQGRLTPTQASRPAPRPTVSLVSCAFAQDKIKNGTVVRDQRDEWSEHQPSGDQENEFIEAHGWDEYANWHLGVDDEASEHAKARYKSPYGDFARVHRCGLLAAEVRAGG